jgi:phosphoribosylformimino-5-aminoimidazole carboxamide ribotide isomerase
MEICPAVDLRGGRVVHVRLAGANGHSVFGDDPVVAAAGIAAAGARWMHLVDLDRAYGTGSNSELVRGLLQGAPPLAIQVGGALRTEAAIDELLDWGAARVVIGCAAAALEPALVERLVRRHGPATLAVAIDATDDGLTPRGAPATTDLSVPDLARRVYDAGIRTAIYTDVRRDGRLSGTDIAGAARVARSGLAVVASGGIASLDDVRAVQAAGLAGALIGRALHEGRITLSEALACAGG